MYKYLVVKTNYQFPFITREFWLMLNLIPKKIPPGLA